MSPEARIYVPKGVGLAQIQDAVSSLGGKVMGFKEHDEPIKLIGPSEISASKLGEFLNNHGLILPDKPSYSDIFTNLQKFPKDKQESLLIGFYAESVKDFPNAEKVAKRLVRINNIVYFMPKKEQDSTQLIKLVKEHLDRINLQELPINIIKDDWDLALKAAQSAARYATRDVVRHDAAWYAGWNAARADDACYAAWYVTWDAAQGVARYAGQDAVRYVGWTIVEDKMPEKGYNKGNPFSLLIDIYEQGCWPIGIVENKKGKKEFMLFIPSIQKTTA